MTDAPYPDVPRHVAIIMDGNMRWAAANGVTAIEANRAGATNLKKIVRAANDLGVRQITAFAFSTENWSRPIGEVKGLMALFAQKLDEEAPELDRDGVRLRFVGERDRVAPKLLEKMEWAEQLTERHDGRSLFVAFDYGGRSEILRAAERYGGGGEQEFRKHLYAPDMVDPDLIIRTSGELRLSNFLLWQAAYSELYFSDSLWPDFDRAELERALADYAMRQRRYGAR
ncbi:MAG: polyprenyl diphosphate synthase [Solirubrobacterales bacterium]